MSRGTLLAIVMLAGAISPARATLCDDLAAGRYPATQNLTSITAGVKKATAKGEFETTAAYSARTAVAGEGIGEFATEWPLESYLFSYDADTEMVSYSAHAIETTCVEQNLDDAMKATTYVSRNKSPLVPYCLTRIRAATKQGSYPASNAYGARRTVTVMSSQWEGIFLGMGIPGINFWTNEPDSIWSSQSLPTFQAKVASTSARSLKANAVAILVVDPKIPFLGHGSYYTSPTLTTPLSHSVETKFVVGDIVCAALADRATKAIFQVRRVPFNPSH